MDKRKVCDLALQALAETELLTPCDELMPSFWCDEHCTPKSPTRECWRRYLERKEAKSDGRQADLPEVRQ